MGPIRARSKSWCDYVGGGPAFNAAPKSCRYTAPIAKSEEPA